MRVSCSTLQRRAFLPSHGASETGPLPRCRRPLNSLVLGGLPGAPELGSPRDKRILDEGLRLLVFHEKRSVDDFRAVLRVLGVGRWEIAGLGSEVIPPAC